MPQVHAEILLDSLNPYNGVRLTTFKLRYPRAIHAELMTHRVFSRNASSSRAIPYKKMRALVEGDALYLPPVWGWNQPGMQQKPEPCPPEVVAQADAIVRELRDKTLEAADKLAALGIHKQQVNRYLEPFGHIAVVLTGTEFANFYQLRSHGDAEPVIQILSDKMLEAYAASVPVPCMAHLPFMRPEELSADWVQNAKRSAARCARVSYLNHEGKEPTLEEDMQLYDRLMLSTPKHASPVEHQGFVEWDGAGMLGPDSFSGNLRGWHQFRKYIANENLSEFDPAKLLGRPNRARERV